MTTLMEMSIHQVCHLIGKNCAYRVQYKSCCSSFSSARFCVTEDEIVTARLSSSNDEEFVVKLQEAFCK